MEKNDWAEATKNVNSLGATWTRFKPSKTGTMSATEMKTFDVNYAKLQKDVTGQEQERLYPGYQGSYGHREQDANLVSSPPGQSAPLSFAKERGTRGCVTFSFPRHYRFRPAGKEDAECPTRAVSPAESRQIWVWRSGPPSRPHLPPAMARGRPGL